MHAEHIKGPIWEFNPLLLSLSCIAPCSERPWWRSWRWWARLRSRAWAPSACPRWPPSTATRSRPRWRRRWSARAACWPARTLRVVSCIEFSFQIWTAIFDQLSGFDVQTTTYLPNLTHRIVQKLHSFGGGQSTQLSHRMATSSRHCS